MISIDDLDKLELTEIRTILQASRLKVEFDVGGHATLIGLVKSAYGRPNTQYSNWITRDKNLLYFDMKRAGKWLSTAGLQLPGGKPFSRSDHTILSKDEFVKRRVEKIFRLIQNRFKPGLSRGMGI